jgi:hypothetical protein
MEQPKKSKVKVVEKKTTITTKPKTTSQRIGDITLRDVKNAGETALNLTTLGGYGVAKKKVKNLTGMKTGGKVTKAKNGKSFPDLNKDGKITKADILKGRGVIAKKGAVIKKAQSGDTIYSKKDRQVSKSMPFKGTVVDRNVYAVKNNNGTVEKGVELKRKHTDGSTSVRKQSRTNAASKVRKQNSSFDSEMNKNMGGMKKKAKTGASMKKCRYGCK